jgi:hypothetical protein
MVCSLLLAAPAASARQVAAVPVPPLRDYYNLFAGPVLVGGAAVWAQRDAKGRWLIRRAGRSVTTLATLPTGELRDRLHPLALSSSGRSLAVVDSVFKSLGSMQYDTLVDRVLLGRLPTPLQMLAGCSHGSPRCVGDAVCASSPGYSEWTISLGAGTAAWLRSCTAPGVSPRTSADIYVRSLGGSPLRLRLHFDEPYPGPTSLIAAGNFIAYFDEGEIMVWDAAHNREAYRVSDPPNRRIQNFALQADGTLAITLVSIPPLGIPPYSVVWTSPAHPGLHPVPGAPYGPVRLVSNRLLYPETERAGDPTHLVLEELPSGKRRFIANLVPHQLAGYPVQANYWLDQHHATWATGPPGLTYRIYAIALP